MSLYTEELQKLYVAYFNRPADPIGLGYWDAIVANQVAAGGDLGTVLTSIGRSFAASPEYAEQYGGKTSVEIVDRIYVNLFGRHAEPDGLRYWSLHLDQGSLSVNDVVRAVSISAAGSDTVAFANKVSVATNFTDQLDTTSEIVSYAGANANKLAKSLLASVTSDAATLEVAESNIGAVVRELLTLDALQAATVTETVNNFTLGTVTSTGTVLDLGTGVSFHASVPSTAVPGYTADVLSYTISSGGVLSFSGLLSSGLSAGQEGALINTILGNQLNTAVVFKAGSGAQTTSYVYANLAGADKFVALPGVDAAGGSSTGVAGGVNVVQIGQPPAPEVHDWFWYSQHM